MGQPSILVQFVPLLFLSAWIGVLAYYLARDKGRNITKWTILGFIPMVNFLCIWYFVGSANLRLERKVDEVLEVMRRS